MLSDDLKLQNRLARRTDELTAFYLLAVAVLVLVFREQVPFWPPWVGLHLVGAVFFFRLRSVSHRRSAGQFLHDWYPVVIYPLFFKEVEFLAGAFGYWGLTGRIQSLEAVLFGGQPSLYLSQQWNWVPLSEYLHFCYFFYMIMVPVVGGYWYASRQRVAFRELILLLSATFYSSYLFFILFPVDSPFYLADPLESPMSDHFFYNLVHEISSRGGARGGAFPSTHVSGSVVLWLVAWKRQRRLAHLLTPIVLGAIVATVYGRFHYALDAVAGLAVALLVWRIVDGRWAPWNVNHSPEIDDSIVETSAADDDREVLVRHNWTITLILLFVASMLTYPRYEGLLAGWPLNFLLGVGICVIYLLLYAFFIRHKLDGEE